MRDMDKKGHSPINTTFNRLDGPYHLKPLSIYSRMVTCVENNSSNSRKDDSNPDEGYETPAKKARTRDLSLDHGYCSPPDLFQQHNCLSHLTPVGGPVLESHNSHVEPLEGDVEWCIGSPIFESSMCQAPLGEEATLDTTYETTLPLQVQVKSVVVVPSQHTSSGKRAAPPLPDQTANYTPPSPDKNRSFQPAKCVSSAKSQREVDWEHRKRLYVHSVTRHIKERPGANQDVMTELLNLMTHVADQTAGNHGRQWQHPSDLTRRNYQRRLELPKMTLHEWRSRNCPSQKRFAKVNFTRSKVP